MSAVDDIAQPGRFWPRRNYASPSGLKVVSDVPPDLANSLDENGSLVTVDPADWIVCFVPGLQRQWWGNPFIRTHLSRSFQHHA